MSSKLSHAQPHTVNVVRQVTEAITTTSTPFLRMGLIKFGGRGTITRLRTGGLVVFSPIKLTEDISEVVDTLGGQVSYLVAPDIEHDMNLGAWKAKYPSAKVIAPHDLREKRAKASKEDVHFDFSLTAENKRTIQWPTDFGSEFDVEFFDGHANKEIVLLHKPSRTIIEADLLFNMPATEQYSKSGESASSGVLTKVFSYFQSLGKGQQRFIWYGLSSPNRPSFNESVKRVAAWDFDKIIPCHGDVIETGGKEVFGRMFAWHLAASQAGK